LNKQASFLLGKSFITILYMLCVYCLFIRMHFRKYICKLVSQVLPKIAHNIKANKTKQEMKHEKALMTAIHSLAYTYGLCSKVFYTYNA